MSRLVRGRAGVALCVALAAAAWPTVGLAATDVAASPTPTWVAGSCADDSGVTVVVDFGSLGGGVQTRCAPEPVSSGFDALTRAGFTYAGTTRFPGLLCRIDGKPSPQQDACHSAPAPDYYWAYWTATEGGAAWQYSDQGAGNRDPAPGSTEGWAFSDGCTRQPGASACPTATTAATTTTTAARSTPATGPAGADRSSTTTSAGGSTTTRPAEGVPTVEGPANGADGADGARTAGPPDDLALEPTAAPAAPSGRSGSPAGAVVGVVVTAALGLGAVLRGRRRSQSAASSEV